MLKFLSLSISVLAIAAPAGAVDSYDAAAARKARISMAQAVTIAERQHVGSQAIEASLNDRMNQTTYEVTVLANQSSHDVRIDAVTGEVLDSEPEAIR